MKKITLLLLLFTAFAGAQTVSVDNNKTPEELVGLLLDNGCLDVTNINYSSAESVAQFDNNGGVFPMKEGVLIRSGQAALTGGPYTGEGLSSEINKNTNAYLADLNAQSGQSTKITDVAHLEFEFVPLSGNFSFDFLFASNEYGEWQCVSSDVFAFVLTDRVTGEVKNLAILPESGEPVSVRNIKDRQYNPFCDDTNKNQFGEYFEGSPNYPLNMRGHTKVLNASSQLVPGRRYHLRLVIGDSNDSNFDSAIFIAAGSFDTTIDLGPNQEMCSGDVTSVKTDLDDLIYKHEWKLDGVTLAGENKSELTITQSGEYEVIITRPNSGCLITDKVKIDETVVKNPVDLEACYEESGIYSYDLTQNDHKVLGVSSDKFSITYFNNMADLNRNIPISQSIWKSYTSTGNETIYLKLTNKLNGNSCDAVYEFKLNVLDPIEPTKPADINICRTINGSSVPVDLTQVAAKVLEATDASKMQLGYFRTANDALNNTNKIGSPNSYDVDVTAESPTIFVRLSYKDNRSCFALTEFKVIINDLPPVDELEDVVECTEYVLPPLVNGNYFTKSGGPTGPGVAMFAGDVIDKKMTVYIFSGPTEFGCTNESSFKVEIIEEYELGLEYCGKFKVPKPKYGEFYTTPGGPDGGGDFIPFGTIFTTDVTVYYYAAIEDEETGDITVCRDEPFSVTVFELPEVDVLDDVVTCTEYILPNLTNGKFFTKAEGAGNELSTGDKITKTTTLYIYSFDGRCVNESSFKVTITPTFKDVDACGGYTLKKLPVGGYFTEPGGQGDPIAEGTKITENTRIYYHAETTENSDCTDGIYFDIDVFPLPPVDELEDQQICEEGSFILPVLTNGIYFTKSNRRGDVLNPGTAITESKTIYINNKIDECDNETKFKVEVRSMPAVDNFQDIYQCEPYVLPELKLGRYFTQPAGAGEELQPGTLVGNTQRVYIYNSLEDFDACYAEDFFTVYVLGVQLGKEEDVLACGSYILPQLELGDYYTESGGNGTLLEPGHEIAQDQTVYVFVSNGTRFICEDEVSFEVKLADKPVVEDIANVEACESYALPQLDYPDYNVGYYFSPDGNDPIAPEDYTLDEDREYTIYVFAQNKELESCTTEKSFTVRVSKIDVGKFDDVKVCDSYELPVLEYVEYYTEAGAQGTQLEAGSRITQSQKVFVYGRKTEPFECIDETSFNVTIVESPVLSFENVEACESYTLPALDYPDYNIGYFWDEAGEDKIQNSELTINKAGEHTIYIHASSKELDACTTVTSFVVHVSKVDIGDFSNVKVCDSYELPVRDDVTYYTEAGAQGTELAGSITASQRVYVYGKTTQPFECVKETSFNVTIVESPVLDFENIEACDSYTLPTLNYPDYKIGYYWDAAGEDRITNAEKTFGDVGEQTVYVIASNKQLEACSTVTSFVVHISKADVDTFENIEVCDSYTLPIIEHIEYYTQPGAQGTQLNAGSTLTESQRVYVYAKNPEPFECVAETDFFVKVIPSPVLDFNDIEACNNYKLPALNYPDYNIDYYWDADGDDKITNSEYTISVMGQHKIYVLASSKARQSCTASVSFVITISGVDVGDYPDVAVCDRYELPEITSGVGEYYTAPGGTGEKLRAGDIISETTDVFVYAKSEKPFFCDDETYFTVQVTRSPVLDELQDVDACGEYLLPTLVDNGFDLAYFWASDTSQAITGNNLLLDEPGTYEIYVVARSTENTSCMDNTTFTVTVHPRPTFEVAEALVCKDAATGETVSPARLELPLDPTEFTANWYFNGELLHTGNFYEAMEPGTYTVESVKIFSESGSDCNYLPTTVEVGLGGTPEVDVEVTQPFEEVASINVTILKGYGEYMFKLNDGEYQESGEFYDVESGRHIIYILNVNNTCGFSAVPVTVVKHPKVFTPNNDGVNDTWNISDLKDIDAKISIFDRYGKLLKDLKPTDQGWTGIYRNKSLPSDSYWFVVSYEYKGEIIEFRSQFALRR
ncbi:MAG: choice-of-anchor L domain-containing protein [Leeuwenhoekiella sp.]